MPKYTHLIILLLIVGFGALAAQEPNAEVRPANLVTNTDLPYSVSAGLQGRHIALWGSHGKFFNKTKELWLWQRPRLMMTCEDLYSSSYVLPYLAPMLENAGAIVMMPRERDVHDYGVVIDKPKSNESHYTWQAEIKQTGDYAVYVSYERGDNNSDAAEYTVNYSGGKTTYKVNQRIGGKPWVYLGTHRFNAGDEASVKLVRDDNVSAGRVKIGGGIGRSGYPQFMEGARYWLEAAGVPQYLYNHTQGSNEYTDDIYARGMWVNYLSYGERADTLTSGLGIPLDLSFAFHTDAGVRLNDSIIGTLVIMSGKNAKKRSKLANGMSRMTSMALADSVQTQVCHDLRALHNAEWTRRKLYNKSYCESRHPEVPSMILELLSHQNFADMRYGLDPKFRFDASRAVYKGILRYLCARDSLPYIVQPLPVSALGCTLSNDTLTLTWRATPDTLEATATPNYYIVYTKTDDNGFDNGSLVRDTTYSIKVKDNTHYQLRVCAGNDGGISMPSGTVAACLNSKHKGTVLIVNGFDRISAPEAFNYGEQVAGFVPGDFGMPDRVAFHFTGEQYDFVRDAPWIDDDAPGFGASYADMEGKLIAGNTFDYAYAHGKAWAEEGYSYVSCFTDAIERYNTVRDSSMMGGPVRYAAVDLLLGEQKTIAAGLPQDSCYRHRCYTDSLMLFLTNYAQLEHGNILVSGAHTGSELNRNVMGTDSATTAFAANVLHYKGHNNHATRTSVVAAERKVCKNKRLTLSIEDRPNPIVFYSNNVDCIRPVGGTCTMRYKDTWQCAAIKFSGEWRTYVTGFPLENLKGDDALKKFIDEVCAHFGL